MVTLNTIDNIISKCLSHRRIKEKLSNLSVDEKMDLLKDDKLTFLEFEDYKKLRRNYEIKKDNLEEEYNREVNKEIRLYEKFDLGFPDEVINEELNPKYNKLFRELEKEFAESTFDYDKRIFENYVVNKNNPIPTFDWEDYIYDYNRQEKYDVNDEGGFVDMLSVKLSADRGSIGDIEGGIINSQDNVNFTPKQLYWLRKYFEDDRLSSFLTYKINGRTPPVFNDVEPVYYEEYGIEEYEEYNLTERWEGKFNNIKSHLDNAIDKCTGLKKPTILFHSGRIDLSLLPGDHGVWKGYKSMSFQEQVMHKHRKLNDDYWNIIALAPTGVKGVCGNDSRFRGYSFVDEHEYLLSRNTGYTVVNMDYETNTEIVMLDE